MDEDLYALMECAPDASADDLKRAWRRLARELHPDRNPAPDAEARFRAVASAWEVLGDPERRAAYDGRRGRVASGGLPETWMADLGDAMERAERWVREGVLPHYAGLYRGEGLEMAVRMLADLEDLRTPRALPPASWWRRRQVDRLADRIEVTGLVEPGTAFSRLVRHGKRIEIVVLPWALHQQGVRDPVVLDDVIVQIVVSRFALALGGWRAPPPAGDDWSASLAWARSRDDATVAEVRRTWAWRLGIGAVLGLMFTAGYRQW
ncbi:MAG: J domain-containing protein [Myxococcales bacterium]|nr:J domain-containing protein [Myxococcales bacterium]